MKKILGLVAILAIASAPAFGAPTMSFFLQLQGDNHAAAYEAGTRTLYTPGTEGDTTVVNVVANKILNWAVRVEVGGDYNGSPILGAANVVFDLVLEKDGVPVATVGAGSAAAQGYFSNINNGDDTGIVDDRPYTAGDPPVAVAWPLLAAFTYTFTGVYGATTADPGRIFDDATQNGPHMKRHTYPTAMGYCLPSPPAGRCSTASGGSLVGTGSGYEQFLSYMNGTVFDDPLLERAGVGIVKGTANIQGLCDGLGSGPIAEGQLNCDGLDGAYVLKVVASNGNNVIRGDGGLLCDSGTTGNFAVKVDPANVAGDTIGFSVVGGVVPCDLAIASVQSVKIHNGSPLGIPVSTAAGPATIETRDGGLSQLDVKYSKAIKAADGTLDTEVTVSGAALNGTPSITGDTLTVNVTSADISCVAVTINGITCAAGGSAIPSQTIKVACRKGDVNGDGIVNVNDILTVRSQSSGVPVDASRAIYDINLDGIVNVNDILTVRGLSSGVATPACTN